MRFEILSSDQSRKIVLPNLDLVILQEIKLMVFPLTAKKTAVNISEPA